MRVRAYNILVHLIMYTRNVHQFHQGLLYIYIICNARDYRLGRLLVSRIVYSLHFCPRYCLCCTVKRIISKPKVLFYKENIIIFVYFIAIDCNLIKSNISYNHSYIIQIPSLLQVYKYTLLSSRQVHNIGRYQRVDIIL